MGLYDLLMRRWSPRGRNHHLSLGLNLSHLSTLLGPFLLITARAKKVTDPKSSHVRKNLGTIGPFSWGVFKKSPGLLQPSLSLLEEVCQEQEWMSHHTTAKNTQSPMYLAQWHHSSIFNDKRKENIGKTVCQFLNVNTVPTGRMLERKSIMVAVTVQSRLIVVCFVWCVLRGYTHNS